MPPPVKRVWLSTGRAIQDAIQDGIYPGRARTSGLAKRGDCSVFASLKKRLSINKAV